MYSCSIKLSSFSILAINSSLFFFSMCRLSLLSVSAFLMHELSSGIHPICLFSLLLLGLWRYDLKNTCQFQYVKIPILCPPLIISLKLMLTYSKTYGFKFMCFVFFLWCMLWHDFLSLHLEPTNLMLSYQTLQDLASPWPSIKYWVLPSSPWWRLTACLLLILQAMGLCGICAHAVHFPDHHRSPT